MDTSGELRRRERLLAVARWAALAGGAAVLAVDRVAEGGGLDLRLEPTAPLVLAALAVVAVAAELGLRRLDDPARLRVFGDAVGVADGLVAVAAVTVVPYGAANAQDAILVLVVLEGAWRRDLPGAMAGWGASAAVLVGRALLAPPDALVGIPAVSLAYRLGLLLVVAVFAGVSQRRLADARRELADVHRARRAVAAPMDTAGIERFDLRCDDIDLRHVVAATVADSEVAVSLDGDLRLVADGARLGRVVWNLLSNAERHGRPPIEVGAARRGGTIELVVRDHGSGLDAAARARLSAGYAAAGGGSGLAIVRQVVTAHGGTVTYRDAGPGACFVVALPAASRD